MPFFQQIMSMRSWGTVVGYTTPSLPRTKHLRVLGVHSSSVTKALSPLVPSIFCLGRAWVAVQVAAHRVHSPPVVVVQGVVVDGGNTDKAHDALVRLDSVGHVVNQVDATPVCVCVSLA